MLDKLFSDEKIFRIFTFCSIVILFFIVLRKNKKEKFTFTKPTIGSEKLAFKESMEEAFGTNFQAIKNLGDVAAQITSSTTPGELTLNKLLINDGSKNVNVLDTIKSMQDTIASKANSADVYTTGEINSKLAGKLNTSGGTITGNLTINKNLNVAKDIRGQFLRIDSPWDMCAQFNSTGTQRNTSWVVYTYGPKTNPIARGLPSQAKGYLNWTGCDRC